MKNKYCENSDITNEADVETFFLMPLFRDMGYTNRQIKPKRALQELSVKKLGARRAAAYRPDFGININSELRMIVEAKSPKENLDNHVLQARDYCATLNGAHATKKPVRYYLLSNGNLTRLYKWDLNEPILELKFSDFKESSAVYKKLLSLIQKEKLGEKVVEIENRNMLELRKAPLKDVNEAFSWCHQFIYKTDNISQGAAFMEFVKIIALKLLSDKRIREKHADLVQNQCFKIPIEDVQFSKELLKDQGRHTPNPLSTIWFADFLKEMEREIALKKKKRIFTQNDEINLSPETITGVVEKLENIFLFGIDADLNGRLFETFLSATMRGKDLGQYFTPRSVVKLGIGLANLHVDFKDFDNTDRVYDGCCGTGGFLIDVLADMWSKVNASKSLSNERKEIFRAKIANEHIFGADIGRDPNLCRIARLNMYLHGDGGASIFNVDALDKELPDAKTDTPEMLEEKKQMRAIGNAKGGYFSAVITNPPFAKTYSTKESDSATDQSTSSRILAQYNLRAIDGGKEKAELRSNLMFMERYCDLLRCGGKLITVIDDGILSGKDYGWFRDWLRSEFLITAVVSLPGDAFQRSAARVKTSLLVLSKRHSKTEMQPNVFMYPCKYVGIDDPARARTLPIDAKNREHAKREIEVVIEELNKFQSNAVAKNKYSVPANKVQDRLDVKHCLMTTGLNVAKWKKEGFAVIQLKDAVNIKQFALDEVIECCTHSETEIPLIVRYDGTAVAGSEFFPADTKHNKLYRVSKGDIIISNIAASYGSIAVVPSDLDGCVVSSEYTVLQANPEYDPSMVCVILRSPVVLSEILLVATGANRTRVKWEAIRELRIPYPAKSLAQKFSQVLAHLDIVEAEAKKKKQAEIDHTIGALLLSSKHAMDILSAFKPPK